LVVFGLMLLVSSQAQARGAEDGMACLRASDLTCAQDVRDELLLRSPGAPDTLLLQARTLFHEGRYDEAAGIVERLRDMGAEIDEYTPYAATAAAAEGLKEARSTGLLVRHDSGIDRVLSEEAVETLAASRQTYDRLFGGGPDHEIVLDIFPTARRFTAASGLPPEAVRTTGVIALSKWNRLLITSPRALARGYNWKDTVAHEYIHLVVSWRSGDRVPVWLQEGLAKHLEGEWRGGRTEYLSVQQQSLLAQAIREDAFVPFEKFQRSMAYLDSGEEAALAFAQVATMVHFMLNQAGDEVLPRLMDRIRDGQATEAAVAELAGFDDFAAFRQGWEGFIAKLPLVEKQLSALPVLLDGEGDELSSDSGFSARADLIKFARLGDLLREANRPEAALIEYEKAADPSSPPSPMLLSRRAICLRMMGRNKEALAIAEEGVSLYPEYPLLQVTTGELREALGMSAEALDAYRSAHDLNPFNPTVEQALARNYAALGQDAQAARHLRYANILATGGAID
jgi:tetratricopeptide (TPR) repeat protein